MSEQTSGAARPGAEHQEGWGMSEQVSGAARPGAEHQEGWA